MRFCNLLCLCVAVILLGATSMAYADVPQLINYQGILLDSGGQPITDSTEVVFAIWDSPIDGDSLWSELRLIPPDDQGRFNILLGMGAAIPDSAFRNDAYLSVKVGLDPEMSPRSRLVSVGYSYRVGTVDGASGGEIIGTVSLPDPSGDTLVLEPDQIVIRGAGGDEEAVYSSSGVDLYTDEPSTLAKGTQVLQQRVILSVGGLTFLDESQEPLIEIRAVSGNPQIVIGQEGTGYTLPTSDGSTDQIMVTDGFGLVNWSDLVGDGGWSDGGAEVYLTTSSDSVGIGTASPGEKLDVVGNIHASGTITSGNTITIDGTTNEITSTSGTISFANNNLVTTGKASFGWNNDYSGSGVFVAGGANTASGDSSAIGGGNSNTADDFYTTVAGGLHNYAGAAGANVGGGTFNRAWGIYSTVGGGGGAPGDSNSASGWYAVISGGRQNIASSTGTVVAGGLANQATGARATVGGGYTNVANGGRATISGGYENTASGDYSSIAGGRSIDIGGSYSATGGGYLNQVDGAYSAVMGGREDTITASADYCMAFGYQVYLDTAYCVAFFDSNTIGRLGINRDDHDGGIQYPIHVGTSARNGNGAHLTFAGQWVGSSSRTFKEDFQPLDVADLLTKLAALPVESWRYKGTNEYHIGPVAEDFAALFNIGSSRPDGTLENKYLASSDVAGVALAAIKELHLTQQELKEKVQRIEGLETQMAKMQAMLQKLLEE